MRTQISDLDYPPERAEYSRDHRAGLKHHARKQSRSLFSTNLDRSAEELFGTDYKKFHISEHNFAVSQITCDASEKMLKRKAEFLSIMEKLKKEKGFETVLLMITDALLEGSRIIYVGSDEAIFHAFSVEPKENTLFLPGIMSRKKQIIPMLTALWG